MKKPAARAVRPAYPSGPFPDAGKPRGRHRLTPLEWLVLAAIAGVLVALLLPGAGSFTTDFYECALCRKLRIVKAFNAHHYRDEAWDDEISLAVARSPVGRHEHRWMHVWDHIESDAFGCAKSWAYLNQPPIFDYVSRETHLAMVRRCEARGKVSWLFERLAAIDDAWNTKDDAKRRAAEEATRALRDDVLSWPDPPAPYPVMTFPAAPPRTAADDADSSRSPDSAPGGPTATDAGPAERSQDGPGDVH